jgi:hypothetical protein
MDVITNYKNDLTFSWHPGCHYNDTTHTYIYGPIGLYGPNTTHEEVANIRKNWVKPRIPDAVSLSINLKNTPTSIEATNAEIWKSVTAVLDKMKLEEPIEVVYKNPTSKRIWLGPKPEYADEINEINVYNTNLRTKINELLDQMRQYATVDEYEILRAVFPKNKDIPDEYYNYNDIIDYKTITVRCKKGTTIYNALLENNTLEEVFPESYAKGTF